MLFRDHIPNDTKIAYVLRVYTREPFRRVNYEMNLSYMLRFTKDFTLHFRLISSYYGKSLGEASITGLVTRVFHYFG